VGGAKARVDSLSHEQAARQRVLYTRKTRDGLRDLAARLESLSVSPCPIVHVRPPSLLYVPQPVIANQHEYQAGMPR
jgi:hypothetical protein